jgi:hypothetical protein
MWYRLGKFVLQYRLVLLIVLFVASGFMTWHALQVKLSYEFSKPGVSGFQKQVWRRRQCIGDGGGRPAVFQQATF